MFYYVIQQLLLIGKVEACLSEINKSISTGILEFSCMITVNNFRECFCKRHFCWNVYERTLFIGVWISY